LVVHASHWPLAPHATPGAGPPESPGQQSYEFEQRVPMQLPGAASVLASASTAGDASTIGDASTAGDASAEGDVESSSDLEASGEATVASASSRPESVIPRGSVVPAVAPPQASANHATAA
jgi:hypothetical protein